MALFYKKLSLHVGDGAPSEAAPAADEVPSCWICHEEGADDEGKPLRRDCSCRGDTASFAHLSCLVEYAKYKTENWKSHEPWTTTTCPQCLQLYQNELAVELTTELVRFVEEQHQGDQPMFLQALNVKLDVLASQRANHEEAKQIANKILSTIESMKVANSLMPPYVRGIEAGVYQNLGMILLPEGTKEGPGAAVEYLEKSQGMRKELGWEMEKRYKECMDENIIMATKLERCALWTLVLILALCTRNEGVVLFLEALVFIFAIFIVI